MLPEDMMEVFELGRKWQKELEQQVEVGPDDPRFLLAQTANKSGSCSDKDFTLMEVKSRLN